MLEQDSVLDRPHLSSDMGKTLLPFFCPHHQKCRHFWRLLRSLVTQTLILNTVLVGGGRFIANHFRGTLSRRWDAVGGERSVCGRANNLGPGRVEAPRSAQEGRSQRLGVGRNQGRNDSIPLPSWVGRRPPSRRHHGEHNVSYLCHIRVGGAGVKVHTGSLGPRIMGGGFSLAFLYREGAAPPRVSSDRGISA